MRVFNAIVRVGMILTGLAAMGWGLVFWHVVARDNPRLLMVIEIQARIVGLVVIGSVLVIGALLFWGQTPRVNHDSPRIRPPAPPRINR